MTLEEVTELRRLAEAANNAEFMTIAMDPAAILDLLDTLDRAKEVIRFYAEYGHWGTDMPGHLTAIDPVDHEIAGLRMRGGVRAREFLASLEGGE